jgi:dihydrofolate reductase
MRRIIAALQVSLDGYIEGSNGELDWVESWDDAFDLLPQIDLCLLGGGMYPGYEQYWSSIDADPAAVSPFTGKVPTPGEVAYARFALATPQVVLSRSLRTVNWTHTRIVRDVEDVRRLKQLEGRDMHAVGGAGLVSSLLNAHLIDELRLVIRPIVLGSGKPLFKDVSERHSFQLKDVAPLDCDTVRLTYAAA